MSENVSISTIKKSIIVFVLLTFSLSSISWFLLNGSIQTLVLMWTPVSLLSSQLSYFLEVLKTLDGDQVKLNIWQ